MNFRKFYKIQEEIAKKVRFIKVKNFNKIVCVDVAYKNNIAFCVAVLFDLKQDLVLKIYIDKKRVKFPYIPGLFFLRESEVILKTLRKIREKYDLIVVDAHGLTHPRKAGLATFIGVTLNKPTIGIAKKYLYGEIRNNIIFVDNNKVGVVLGKYYSSIGSNIDFESMIEFFKKINFKYPKAMKIADRLSKIIARGRL
ncbi:MAG: endonuclease V [Candidatus Aenigmatarchaeota archaeon]